MEWISTVVEFLRSLDDQLLYLIEQYHTATYFILAAIIFCETGLVVTPFLPGDSLLFAAGAATAATNVLSVWLLIPLLMIAAIAGDNVNYFFGRFLGDKVFKREFWFLKRSYLQRTEEFFADHGGKTLIIARFVPIVRTFAPFVAGVGQMHYPRFLAFCLIGCVLWVPTLTLAGFYFGRLEVIKQNFELVIFAIIAISLLPVVIEWLRHRNRRAPETVSPEALRASMGEGHEADGT